MFSILRRNLKTGRVTVPVTAGPAGEHELVGAELKSKVARLLGGRSLHVREVDAGSCNGCELEITGLSTPTYDIERFGVHFVASPRHADVLLVTGPVTRQMALALAKTYEAAPEPRIVIASGDCAVDCGVFAGSYAVAGPVESFIPVDIKIKGCPPSPMTILRALLAACDRLPR
ncbi:MAG: NADH-quinone oxidoreductase subunit B family protein [Elusimicrobia bacterium]|nr:NADH-quinone oxidoreductase subunit B family protein [Elusimicrobiota bacterium]